MPLNRDMSPEQAVVAMNTLLDLPEARFPMSIDREIPRIRELFYSATKNQWDPRTDIDWDAFDVSQYTEEQRFAARQYWSRRAWSEYGAVSESPMLQVRFCEEKRPTDMALFFSLRSQEETRHAEVCYRVAEKLGGYMEKPVQDMFQGTMATHGVRKATLDPSIPLEGIIAALVCTAEEIAFDVFRHLSEITEHPVIKQICKNIMRDEVRHCAFGWYFLEHALKGKTPEQVRQVEEAVITMIEKVELQGYHSSWLAPDNPASAAEMAADRITWEAGLGATVEEAEKPVFIDSLRRTRERMKSLGINLPEFHHPKLGTI